MASKRIKGFTVEIGGDTTGLSKALAQVDKNIKSAQTDLKDVERLLKLDPTNIELLAQKQKLLTEAVADTEKRLETLKTASEQAAQTKDNYTAWQNQYEPIQQEIDKTVENLKKLKTQDEKAKQQLSSGEITQEQYSKLQDKIKSTEENLQSLKDKAKAVSNEFGNPVSPQQYDSLQREIIETEQSLKNLQSAENQSETAFDKLKQEISEQDKELNQLNEQYKNAVLEKGRDSDEAKALASQIQALSQKQKENKSQLEDAEKAASDLRNTESSTGTALDKLKQKISEQDKELDKLNQEYKTAVLEKGKDSSEAKALASQIQALSQKQKENKSQLESVEKAAHDVTAEEKTLTERLKDQKSELDKLKSEYVNAVTQYDKNSKEAKSLAKQINSLSGEIDSEESALREAESSADKFDKTVKEVGETSEKASGGISSAAVAVGTFIGNLASNALQIGIDKLKEFTTSTIQTGSELESKMSGVVATLGYSMEELHDPTSKASYDLEMLTEKAKEMGRTTAFSSSEAADALTYMAMAGWKSEQQVAALEPVMNLTAASGEELGTVADIVTDSMTALGLKAEDAAGYADILAATSSNANTNVGMLGESFKYAAPIIGTMSKDEEQAAKNTKDLAIALGTMANAGIKGEQAGSALRNSIINLVKPTKQQAAAMSQLGLIATETTRVFDDEAITKAQSKVADKTAALEKTQLAYNSAVAKYGESSKQAQTALINMQTAERHLTEAQDALTQAQQGTIQTVAGQSVFADEAGNMKSLGEMVDILRSALSDCSAELFDSEGNLKDYDTILSEVEQSEDGLTKAEQLKNAAIIFGKQNVAGMLSLINASTEDYSKLADAIYNCDGAAEEMAKVKLDNLAGDVTLMKSAFSGLQEAIFDGLDRPLRKVVQSLTNKLLPALTGVIEGKDGAECVLRSAIVNLMTTISVQLRNILPKIMTIMGTILSAMMQTLPQFTSLAVTLVTGFIQGFVSSLPLIVSAALELVTALTTSIMKLLPELIPVITELVSILSNGLKENIPLILDAATDLIQGLVTGIAQNLPLIAESALSLIMALADGLLKALPELFAVLPDLIRQLADGLLSSIDMIIDTGLTLFLALIDALPEIITGLLAVLPVIITSIVGGLLERVPAIIDAGITLLTALVDALPKIIEGIIEVIPDIITAILDAVLSNLPAIVDAGFRLLVALIDKSDEILDTIASLAPEIISAVVVSLLDNLGAIWQAGKDIFFKVGEGLTSTLDSAKSWGSDIISNLVDGIFGGIGKIADAAEGVGEKIWEYLHFSEPEKGPLADFSSWMPDFMGGLADGISSGQGTIENAVKSCGKAISDLTHSLLSDTFISLTDKTAKSMQKIDFVVQNSLNNIRNFNKQSLSAVQADSSSLWTGISNTAVKALNYALTAVSNQMNKLQNIIWNGMNNAGSYIRNQVNSSWYWGYDMMQNLINGINYQIGNLINTVSAVANVIHEYLHFSVPDKGPLTDFENWMPDFMRGLSDGLLKNRKVLEKAVKSVSESLKMSLDSDLTLSMNSTAIAGIPSGTVNNYYSTDNSQTFNQTNNSPKSLSRFEIRQDAKNLMRMIKK
ncbi:MAG: phage tail tape measure protein [Oscillospiraceae bacterium]|nr:phage tail tape measure protein [Oscillospiraceae bacterium]